MAQTQTEIRALLAGAGLAPNRRLGQNFLIDGNLMRKLIAAAELNGDCSVLEVGAGTGNLTELLIERAGHVVAVEIDAGLYRLLADRLGGCANLTLLHTDVLDTKHRISPQVLDAIQQGQQRLAGPLVVVANLPYNAATPLLADLLLLDRPPARMCVTVQKEVGDRITAEAGCGEYGPLSVLVQTACRVQRIARVPPQAFWPKPNVESAVLRLDLLPPEERPVRDLPALSGLLHTAFAHRRKTLRHNLGPILGDASEAAWPPEFADLPSLRAEQVPPQRWCDLANHLTARRYVGTRNDSPPEPRPSGRAEQRAG